MLRILHITAHMGGGVGKVLSGISAYAEKDHAQAKHIILMLEPPEKLNFVNTCKDSGAKVVCSSDLKLIEEQMLLADVVQIEWWHHPKMAEFLHNFPQIPVRLVVWCHVSGCSYPLIPFEFIKVPHCFIFTSKYSLENLYWSQQQKNYALGHTQVINSSGGFEDVPRKTWSRHTGFNIGYCGTLSYSKLHPDFAVYASAVDVPGARFILVGDTVNQAAIERDAKRMGIMEKIEFTGYTGDIYKELARFDIFAYPLNPEHFGTTENALLEAMATGLPVVALNQCAEKYLIEHMETGILANNVQEYADGIRYLYENPAECNRIGEKARKFVLGTLSLENTVQKMNRVYEAVMDIPQRIFEFDTVFGSKPYEWFLSCLGPEKKAFEDSIDVSIMSDLDKAGQIEQKIIHSRQILKEKSKSSIAHFARYFPQDAHILYWRSLIDHCGV